jgi:hypothetical protein
MPHAKVFGSWMLIEAIKSTMRRETASGGLFHYLKSR